MEKRRSYIQQADGVMDEVVGVGKYSFLNWKKAPHSFQKKYSSFWSKHESAEEARFVFDFEKGPTLIDEG